MNKPKLNQLRVKKDSISSSQLDALIMLNVSNFNKPATLGGRNAVFLRSFDKITQIDDCIIVSQKTGVTYTVRVDGSLSINLPKPLIQSSVAA